MIFFDWNKILKLSKSNIEDIVVLIYILTYNLKYPSGINPKRKHLYGHDLKGDSFLLNPESLLKNELGANIKQIADYIGLASFRSYLDYELFNKKSLNLKHTTIDLNVIKKNPLLNIVNNEIHFKYEE